MKKTILILFVVLNIYSCKTLQYNVPKDISNSQIAYVLGNMESDKTILINTDGYFISIFKYGDPKGTKISDFDGTGEVIQIYLVNITPDGEYTEKYSKMYKIKSKIQLSEFSGKISFLENKCLIKAKNAFNEDVIFDLSL